MKFTHDSLPQRVRFATGEADAAVAAEIKELGAQRVMVIASEREAETAARTAAGIPVALHYDEVVMHVPVDVAQRARDQAAEADVDARKSVV